ncbi:hypothetical protein ACXYMO_17630 [Arenibacterium sp. CAU 1754]
MNINYATIARARRIAALAKMRTRQFDLPGVSATEKLREVTNGEIQAMVQFVSMRAAAR